MSRKTKLRLTSLILLVAGAIFLFCAISCPTLGHVFHLGPFRIAAEQRQIFYRLYAATVGLFLLSFFVRERKPPKAP